MFRASILDSEKLVFPISSSVMAQINLKKINLEEKALIFVICY